MKKIIYITCILILLSLINNSFAQVSDNEQYIHTSVKKLSDKSLQIEGFRIIDDFQQYLTSVLIAKKSTEPKLDKQKYRLIAVMNSANTLSVDDVILSLKEGNYRYFIISNKNQSGGFMKLDSNGIKTLDLTFESVVKK